MPLFRYEVEIFQIDFNKIKKTLIPLALFFDSCFDAYEFTFV